MPASPRPTVLAAATADVVEAAQDMVAEQIAVARLEARADVARILRAAAAGALALVCATVALVVIVLAGTQFLGAWLPQSATLIVVGGVTLSMAYVFVRRALAALPSSSTTTPTLSLPSHE